MPGASDNDKRSMTLRFRPIDWFFLGLEGAELMVRKVFDYTILNGRPFRTTVRPGFDVNLNLRSPLMMSEAQKTITPST
jgi:hypothetical protein